MTLLHHVKQALQSMQQTAAIGCQAVEYTSASWEQRSKFCSNFEDVQSEQVPVAQMQARQEGKQLCAELETVLCEQLGVVQDDTMQKLGIEATKLTERFKR